MWYSAFRLGLWKAPINGENFLKGPQLYSENAMQAKC